MAASCGEDSRRRRHPLGTCPAAASTAQCQFPHAALQGQPLGELAWVLKGWVSADDLSPCSRRRSSATADRTRRTDFGPAGLPVDPGTRSRRDCSCCRRTAGGARLGALVFQISGQIGRYTIPPPLQDRAGGCKTYGAQVCSPIRALPRSPDRSCQRRRSSNASTSCTKLQRSQAPDSASAIACRQDRPGQRSACASRGAARRVHEAEWVRQRPKPRCATDPGWRPSHRCTPGESRLRG